MSLGAGERIGPYEVVAPMGAGLMGEVYRARDPRLGREVAIKMMTGPYRDDPERLNRLREEARVAGALDHPNVLVVHDVGDRDGVPYLVCELLEGNTLRARLADGALERTLALNVAVQIARGLDAIHRAGAVHGDLRPANLMLLGSGRVKILDFGIARVAQGATGDGTATRTGAMAGTAAYMAPEQLRGAPVDARTDLFSFGVILHEMLSGARPFSGASDVELGHAILEEDPARLADTSIDSIARRCMAKDPADRYQSAHDLAFALEALLAGTRAPALRRPWRTRAIPVAAVLAAVACGTALGLFRQRESLPPAPRSQMPSVARLPFAAYPLTSRRGVVGAARFTSDKPDSGIVYSASWDGNPPAVYLTDVGSAAARELFANAELLTASTDGGLAILMRPRRLLVASGRLSLSVGTLAVTSIAGGTPERIADDVVSADWSRDDSSTDRDERGGFVVTRVRGGRGYVEWPIGNVVYQGEGVQTAVRASPDGRLIAFIDYDRLPQVAPNGQTVGEIVVIDRRGKVSHLSRRAATRLAWIGYRDELWAGGHGGISGYPLGDQPYGIYAGDAQQLELHDIGRMGRMLVVAAHTETTRQVRSSGAAAERSISLRSTDRDREWASDDGQIASPDAAWILTQRREVPGDPRPSLHYVLEPTGPGQPLDLAPFEGVTDIGRFYAWSPDSKRAFFECFTPRGAICTFDTGGRGELVARDKLPRGWVSPDGRWLLATPYGKKSLVIVATDGSETTLPAPLPADVDLGYWSGNSRRRVVGWTADGKGLLFWGGPQLRSADLERFDIETGVVSPWRSLAPTDLSGELQVLDVEVRRGEQDYEYRLDRSLSGLYLLEPLLR